MRQKNNSTNLRKGKIRPSLFWDAGRIDPEKNAKYIIARVLDFGDIEDIRALRAEYSQSMIMAVVRNNRSLLPKSANYWAIYYGIPRKDVSCLKRYFRPKR